MSSHFIFSSLAVLALVAVSSGSNSVNLAWDPNPEPDIAGYRIHLGTESGKYSTITEVGNVSATTLAGLDIDTTYYAVVTAFNTSGLESLPSNEISFVVDQNSPPLVAVTSPLNGSTLPAVPEIVIEATASDSDGTIVAVEFFVDGVKLGESLNEPYQFNWGSPPPGTYTLSAIATDDVGSSSTSALNVVTIEAAPPELIPANLVRAEVTEGKFIFPMFNLVELGENGESLNIVQAAYPSPDGYVSLSFDAPISGDYHVWCHVNGPDETSDSFYMAFDDSPDFFTSFDPSNQFVFHFHNTDSASPESYENGWIWSRVNELNGESHSFNLVAGEHELTFRVRESGAKLHQVILTTDPNFDPRQLSLTDSPYQYYITKQPSAPASVSAGDSVQLSVSTAANVGVQFQWYKDTIPIPGATDASLILDGFAAIDEGTYSVLANFARGFLVSNPVLLEIDTVDSGDPGAFIASAGINPMPVVTSIQRNEAGLLVLDFGNPSTESIRVFVSEDLRSWGFLDSLPPSNQGSEFIDTGSLHAKKRYYRFLTTP